MKSIDYAFLITFGLIFLGGIWAAILKLKEFIIFMPGHNPYHRICKKCGAHQIQMQLNVTPPAPTWWEEVYPIGNNPACECHKYAEYHG